MDNNVILGSMYVVNKKKLPPYTLNELRKKLVARPKFTNVLYKKKEYKLYKENKNIIAIPRFYGIQRFGIPKNIRQFNHTPTNNLVFTGTLFSGQYNNQQYAANLCLQKLNKYNVGQGLLVIPTGCGKTVTALWIVSQLKLKTMIVVNNTILLDQWKKRIKQFIPTARIGLIRSTKCQIKDYDISIATIQSLYRRKYDGLNQFGTIVFDECHHVPAYTFSQVIFKLNPRYFLGLSATPYRKDGLFYVLEWLLGPILYEQNDRAPEDVRVISHQLNYSKFKEIMIYSGSNKVPNRSKMINELCENKKRNTIIVDSIINQYITNLSFRKILVFTSRVNHVILLKQLIQNKMNEHVFGIITSIYKNINKNKKILNHVLKYCLHKIPKFGVLHGSIAMTDREKEMNADILVVTYNIAKEGLDLKGYNTAILTTPSGSIVQTIGRVLKRGNVDKGESLILDFVDKGSLFWNMGHGRNKIYKKMNFKINKIYWKI